MIFGVRCNYHADEEGDGIIPVPVPQVEGETLQLKIINNRKVRGLNHAEPNLRVPEKAKLDD